MRSLDPPTAVIAASRAHWATWPPSRALTQAVRLQEPRPLSASLMDVPTQPSPLPLCVIACVISIAKFVIQLGIAMYKLIRALVNAFKQWKTFKNIVKAFISGEARKKLGTETETILKVILGIEDVLKKCV